MLVQSILKDSLHQIANSPRSPLLPMFLFMFRLVELAHVLFFGHAKWARLVPWRVELAHIRSSSVPNCHMLFGFGLSLVFRWLEVFFKSNVSLSCRTKFATRSSSIHSTSWCIEIVCTNLRFMQKHWCTVQLTWQVGTFETCMHQLEGKCLHELI